MNESSDSGSKKKNENKKKPDPHTNIDGSLDDDPNDPMNFDQFYLLNLYSELMVIGHTYIPAASIIVIL